MEEYNRITSAFADLVGIDKSEFQFDISNQGLISQGEIPIEKMLMRCQDIFLTEHLDSIGKEDPRYASIFDSYRFNGNQLEGWMSIQFLVRKGNKKKLEDFLDLTLRNSGLGTTSEYKNVENDLSITTGTKRTCQYPVVGKPLFQVFESDRIMFLEIIKWE